MPLSAVSRTPLPFLNRFEKYTLSLQVALAEKLSAMSSVERRWSAGLARTISHDSSQGMGDGGSSGHHHDRRPCDDPDLWRAALAGIEDFASAMIAPVSMPGFVPGETAAALILRAIADSQDASLNPTGDLVLRAPIRAQSTLSIAAASTGGSSSGGVEDEVHSAAVVTGDEPPFSAIARASALRLNPRALSRDIIRCFNLQLLQLVRRVRF
jgi:hypothetical protein